jgi:hypothetical protein
MHIFIAIKVSNLTSAVLESKVCCAVVVRQLLLLRSMAGSIIETCRRSAFVWLFYTQKTGFSNEFSRRSESDILCYE